MKDKLSLKGYGDDRGIEKENFVWNPGQVKKAKKLKEDEVLERNGDYKESFIWDTGEVAQV